MRYLLSLLAAFGLLAALTGAVQASTPVTQVYGSSVACDPLIATCTPIPLTLTTLCTVSCPLASAPSYTDSTRFWGKKDNTVGACFTSTNGGVAWAACTTQAFVAGFGAESYASASDGSVIAVGNTGGANCTIRRSTNNATSWTDVFTDTNSCQGAGQPGQLLYCLANGNCEYVVNQGGTARVYRSSNNGATWIQGTTGTGGNCTIIGAQWNGSQGIMPSENPACGGGNIAKAWSAAGDTWSDSAVWNGTQGDCWTPVIYNGNGQVICQGVGATPDGRYTMRSPAGTNLQSLNLPDAVINSIDSGGPAVGFKTNTLYILAQANANAMTVWVSQDNLVTFVRLGTFGGGGAGPRGGNAFVANGCVYFSAGLTPMFGKIC